MSESNSLIHNNKSKKNPQSRANYQAYTTADNDDEDKYFNLLQDSRKRYTIYSICSIALIALFYVFMVILPSSFIPQAKQLPPLTKVSSIPVYLNHSISTGEQSGSLRAVDRIVLVGDVHGSLKPFKKLLRKINYNKDNDYIVLLGDFLTKGKDSIPVLDLAVKYNLGCIIGNHEYYLLNKYTEFHNLPSPMFYDNETGNSDFMVDKFNDDPEYLLAKKLQPKHVKYLSNCPLILELGSVPLHKKKSQERSEFAQGVAVHAGLRWDLRNLEDQSPSDVLEMRKYLPPFFNQTTDDPTKDGAINWSKIWNEKQEQLEDKSDQRVVYYGHYASRGLEIRKFSKGLDTGCYKKRQLSAMVLSSAISKNGVVYNDEIVQVDC